MPLDWLQIRSRPGNQGSVKLSPLDALPEPTNLGRLTKVIALGLAIRYRLCPDAEMACG